VLTCPGGPLVFIIVFGMLEVEPLDVDVWLGPPLKNSNNFSAIAFLDVDDDGTWIWKLLQCSCKTSFESAFQSLTDMSA